MVWWDPLRNKGLSALNAGSRNTARHLYTSNFQKSYVVLSLECGVKTLEIKLQESGQML